MEAFRGIFSGLVSPGNPIYEPARVIGECELVLIHGTYLGLGGPIFDVFRVEEGRLVEHWDSAGSAPGPNASGRGAVDGEVVVSDVESSVENEARVLELFERVLVGGDLEAAGDYLSPALVEHDPRGSDGLEAFVQAVLDQGLSYREVHHSIGDGNFVFVMSEGAVAATDVAHYDLFRVEGGLVVEHWRSRRDVPATTASGLGIF